jgi:nucleoside 2-deoxyribosyltransferase
MKIYCARPISGCTADEVFDYYQNITKTLKKMGYEVLVPMYGKSELRTEVKFKAYDYRSPISTNKAIIERDHWMVCQCDLIFANLCNSKIVSIGTVMELAWAHHMHKHSVVTMEDNNIHQHAFMLEASDVLYDSMDAALLYLEDLIKGIF